MFTSLKTYGGVIREIFLDKGLKEAVKAGGEVFTSSANSFFTSFAGSATLGIATFFAMKKALEALSDAYNLSYDSAMKNTQANVDSFNTTKSEIENLESEAQQYKDTLSSLSDKYEVDLSGIESIDEMITKLRQSGKLELTDEAELAKIDSQNAALERQLAIKEKLLLSQQKQAASDARDALGRGEQSVAQQVAQFVPGGKKRYQGQVNNVGVVEAVNENVLAIQEYENAIEKAEKAMKDLDPDSKAWKEQEENINSYNEAIEKLTEDLNTKETDLTTLLSAFSVDGEGLVALDGFEKEFKSVKDAVENLNNINLSPAEQKLAKIESFFDGSAGKNFIKDELLETTEQGKKASVVLREMGYDLESAGLDALTLNKYFEDMAANAKDAADSIYDYTASVSDVSNALESENKDKDWSSISDARKEINELLKEGKTGTDDVEMFAKFVNPERVKKLAEKGGKYIADAYEEAIKEVAPIMNRWFGEDETKSMENFVDDFEKKGLWDVKTDSKGLWDITTQFESTYEAAEKFDVGVEVIETALRGLEAYGYVFDDVLFSGDAISEYQTNLNQIKSIYDNLEDSELKSRLKDIIDQSEVDDFENNIDKITEDKIIKISFEADLASIQAEIDNYLALIEGGANTVENNAQVIAGNERYISKAEEGVGFDSEGFVIPVEYKTNEASLEKLKDELRITKDENKKLEIQAEIQNIQNVQKDLLLAFSDANPTINAESTTTEIQKAWDSFIVSAEAQEILAKVNFEGADTPQEVLVNAKMNNAEEVSKQISEMGRNTSIIFDADVNGAVTEVEAVKDVFGNIRYWADVNGVKSQLKAIENQDGTVTYIPITEAVDKHDYDQDGIVDYKGIFPTSAPNLKATVKYSYSYAHDGTLPSENLNKPRSSGTFLSPAHKDGTAYNILNTLPLSAYAGGRVGLSRNERALVNEEYINGHSESIVRDGVWRLIPGGAHLENLKQGDLIFSAQQTEDLLRSGRTPGHARAFAQGNVIAPAYRLGNSSDGSSDSSKNKSSSKSKTSDSSSKDDAEKIDWIERKIKSIELAIESLGRTADVTYINWADRNGDLSKQISKVSEEINIQNKAYDRYIKESNSVGLSSTYKKKVQDGTIDIQSIKSEKLRNQISEYQKWYDKAIDAKTAAEELKDELADLAQQKFDNVVTQYENELSGIEHQLEMIEGSIDLIETKGYLVSSDMYKQVETNQNSQLKQLKAQKTAMEEALSTAMKEGKIKKNSEMWYEMQSEIWDVDEAIQQMNIDLAETKNNIREADWELFDKTQELLGAIQEESDFLIDLMSEMKMFNKDTAAITDEGLATLGLHAVNYNAYMSQAADYAAELKKINDELAKEENKNNVELLERRDELLEQQRDMIRSAEDEKYAIKDIVSDGYDAFLEAMDKLIDKRKEMLDTVADLYDYEKNITEQTEEIARLEKQLVAYQGDSSEEAKSTIQQLKVDLEEAKENLEETEMDQYLKDQEIMLDTFRDQTEQWLNSRLDNIDLLIQGVIDATNGSSEKIAQTLDALAKSMGYDLTDSMADIWGIGTDTPVENVVQEVVNGVIENTTSTETAMDDIREFAEKLPEKDNTTSSSTGSTTSSKPTTSTSTSTSTTSQTSKDTSKSTSTTTAKEIKVGGKINAKGAKIYDYAGDKSGERQYYRNDPIYKVLAIKNGYLKVRHHKLKSGVTGWFKKGDVKAYKTGGLVDETGLAWLDGTKRKPEMVLDAKDTENLIELKTLLKEQSILGNLTKVNESLFSDKITSYQDMMFSDVGAYTPKFIPSVERNVSLKVDIGDIQMYGVNDPETFAINLKDALIHNSAVKNIIQSNTIGVMTGKNSLNKFKYAY